MAAHLSWYIAKLVFQVQSGEGTHTPQFDEQWRMVRADEVSWAREKASVLGRMDECQFMNDQKEEVACRFIEVAAIHKIGPFEDGAEIFSDTHEPEDASEYIKLVKLKARKSFALERKKESNVYC